MSGGNKLQLSLRLGPACQEQQEGRKHKVDVSAPNPESYWQRAVYLPLIDHLIQEMNNRLLSQEDRFLAQYLLLTKVQGLGNDVQGKMYEAYSSDLTDERVRERDVMVEKWLPSTGERPTTLADTAKF